MPVGAAIKSEFYIISGQVVSWNGNIVYRALVHRINRPLTLSHKASFSLCIVSMAELKSKSKLSGTDLIHADGPLSSTEVGPSISVTSSKYRVPPLRTDLDMIKHSNTLFRKRTQFPPPTGIHSIRMEDIFIRGIRRM